MLSKLYMKNVFYVYIFFLYAPTKFRPDIVCIISDDRMTDDVEPLFFFNPLMSPFKQRIVPRNSRLYADTKKSYSIPA